MTQATPTPSQGERGSDVAKLIERLGQADGPDQKLDGEVKLAHAAFLIAEGKTAAEAKAACGGDLYDDPLPYTASIDAALTLVPENCQWTLEQDSAWVRWMGKVDVEEAQGVLCHRGGECTAIALTLAALKARQAQ